MYLNIFRTHALFKKIIWFLIVATACYAPVFIPYFMTQCSPVSAAWDEQLSRTNCRPLKEQEIASVAVHLVLDTAIVAAPLPIVWGLKMPRNKKLGVSAMFSLGLTYVLPSFASRLARPAAVSVVTCWLTVRVAGSVIGVMVWRMITTTNPNHGKDMVYDLFYVAVQGQLEIWLGILAANLPVLGPLLTPISRWPLARHVLSYWKATSAEDSSPAPSRGVALRTFGNFGRSAGIDRDDFQRLNDENGGDSQRGIVRDWEVRVSVETSRERGAAGGYSASVQA